jgi:hypothetical protein
MYRWVVSAHLKCLRIILLSLKNSGFARPLKTLEKDFNSKYPGKPLEFLYYPWKTLENLII